VRAPPGPGLGTRGSPRWGAPQGSGARASQRKRRNRLRGQIRATLGHPLHDPHPRRRFDRRYLSGLAWPTPHPRRFLAVSCCLPRPSRPSHPGLSRHAKRLPQAHAIRVRQKLRSMWNWARFSFLSVFRNPVPRRQIFFFFWGGGGYRTRRVVTGAWVSTKMAAWANARARALSAGLPDAKDLFPGAY